MIEIGKSGRNYKSIFFIAIMAIGFAILICYIYQIINPVYHNNINLVVKIDGQQYNMNNRRIDYSDSFGKVIETNYIGNYGKTETSIIENFVKFKKGMYGKNEFEFTIPKTNLGNSALIIGMKIIIL